MIERIREAIERHRMFSPGQRVGVAVSGGADSVFLLHALRELGPTWNLHLSVVHIDHGMRGESSLADADFVRGLAAQFGVPFHLREATVSEMPGNLEQSARRVRHSFFLELIGSGVIDRVATGHTLSDQSETVLYRLLRGSGMTGLSGIRPVTSEGLVRPLLYLKRSQIEVWLRERQIGWREDETNQNRTFARNRLRHEVLPLLREAFNPRVDEALAHLARLAQDEEDYWTKEILAEYPAPGGGMAKFRTSELTGVHPALARRIVRRAVEGVKGDLRQIDFDQIETVLEMARASEGSGRVQLNGVDIYRSFDWIRITRVGYDPPRTDFEMEAAIPGLVVLPEGRGTLKFSLIHQEKNRERHDKLRDELDWQRLAFLFGANPGLLEVRNWRPGDQYHRAGQSQPQKIKLLFQEARIPLWDRRHWPVLTCRGRIVWTRLFGPAAEFGADSSTQIVLHIDEKVQAE